MTSSLGSVDPTCDDISCIYTHQSGLPWWATRAGGLLNFADLSRSLALPQTTLKRYFTLLEATFLVQLLRPWSSNLGQRLIQTPKIYLNDTGLLAHLLGLSDRVVRVRVR